MFLAPERHWNWTFHQAIPSDVSVGHQVIDKLTAALEESHWEGRDLFHVRLAVEEAVVNAIQHGNKESPSKVVAIDFRVAPECCYLQVTDQGLGFDPAQLRDCTDEEFVDKPRGRGVMLIKELMSRCEYNACGNQVTMLRLRNDPALALPHSDD